MRGYYQWLPQKTSQGDDPACQNCKRYGEKNEHSIDGTCGRYGYLCGSWEEAKQEQLTWDIDTSVKDYFIDACDDCTQQDHQKCMECMCADEYVGPDEDKVRAAADDYCNKIKKVFGR